MDIDAAWDIETVDWTTFVVGGIWDGEFFEYRKSEDEFYELLLERFDGCTLWTWNGGLFDMLWLADVAERRNHKVWASCAGTRVTRMVVSDGRRSVTHRDGCALLPFSLARASQLVESAGLKGDWDHERTRLDMGAGEWAEFLAYLERDCAATYRTVAEIKRTFESHDWTMRGTIGGSAWATAHARGVADAEWHSWSDYNFARRGYYGGRVQVFQAHAPAGHRYDIHSAYPAALVETSLPTGEYYRRGRVSAAKKFRRGWPGIYRARVEVPDCLIPPLPHRVDGRVWYPTGSFEGTWTALELDYAASLGVTVDIRRCIAWEDDEPVLAPLMAEIWAHRAEVGPSTMHGKLAKWFANSITGKLAQQPQSDKIIINPSLEMIKFCDGRPSCRPKCSGRCGAWEAIGMRGNAFAAKQWQLPDCGHIQWAAYLTASARIKLHRQLVADGRGGETAVYCDTDSVYATTERSLDIGDELGQWGYDGPFEDFWALAPKAYRYKDPTTGEVTVRAKGLSGISDEQFRAYFAGHEVNLSRGARGLKSSLRSTGPIFRRKSLRRSTKHDGERVGDRRIDSGTGRTYPFVATDIP